jgi:hypothetical protein
MSTSNCMYRPYIDTNNPQCMKLRRFNIVPLLASGTFIAPYFHYVIPKRRIFSLLFLLCAYDSSVFQNFKIFTHLLPTRRVPFVDGSDGPLNSEWITSTIGSEKFQTFIILVQYFEIMTKRKRGKRTESHRTKSHNQYFLPWRTKSRNLYFCM